MIIHPTPVSTQARGRAKRRMLRVLTVGAAVVGVAGLTAAPASAAPKWTGAATADPSPAVDGSGGGNLAGQLSRAVPRDEPPGIGSWPVVLVSAPRSARRAG